MQTKTNFGYSLCCYIQKKKKMLFFWYPIQLMKMRILSSDVCGFYRKYIFIYSFRMAKIKKTESKFIRVYITLGNFFFAHAHFLFTFLSFFWALLLACLHTHLIPIPNTEFGFLNTKKTRRERERESKNR